METYGRTDGRTDERTKFGKPHEGRPLLGPAIILMYHTLDKILPDFGCFKPSKYVQTKESGPIQKKASPFRQSQW